MTSEDVTKMVDGQVQSQQFPIKLRYCTSSQQASTSRVPSIWTYCCRTAPTALSEVSVITHLGPLKCGNRAVKH